MTHKSSLNIAKLLLLFNRAVNSPRLRIPHNSSTRERKRERDRKSRRLRNSWCYEVPTSVWVHSLFSLSHSLSLSAEPYIFSTRALASLIVRIRCC